ncbi:hypothetical protein V6N13_059443 [Hibiscus sabdariffa]
MANTSFSARYKMIVAKNRWEEQGFYLDDSLGNYGLEPIIYNRLHELGWFALLDNQPKPTLTGCSSSTPTMQLERTIFLFVADELQPTQPPSTPSWACQMMTPASTRCLVLSKKKISSRSKIFCVKRAQLETQRAETHILRAAVPTSPSDKYQAEKTGWTRAVYMRKMNIENAIPLNMAMPTPPTSPIHMPAADTTEAGPSVPATAPPTPAVVEPSPVSSHTTSPAPTHAAMPTSRESTPDSPLGCTPYSRPPSPPPVQSEEAVPLHILQLRNQLQRIETRQLQMQAETKVFQQNLINFLCYQFPAAATYFNAQPEATPAAQHSTATQPMTSANPSAKAGNTEELHFSSDDENDVFDWSDHSSPDEGQAAHQPAQKRRRRHIITSDSDDENNAEVPTTSADPSISFTF